MKPGPKPLGKVNMKWSAKLAYAIGLITTDGNLSKDGRHIDLTSKDEEMLINFMKCLGIKVKIGIKRSGYKNMLCHRIQFGDVIFYKFLLSIGLMPKKSKILSELNIPAAYFFDFLRGHFDGDGSFYSYWDTRWKSSFMYYLVFISASFNHILWLRKKNHEYLKISGHITQDGRKRVYHLKYAKNESLMILKKFYYSQKSVYLSRKYLKINKALNIIGLAV